MATDAPPLRLTGAMRLQSSREFTRTRSEGRRLTMGCLIANWRSLPAGEISRLGVITSRRIGSAVVRSRARRLLRETFRLHQLELRQPVDLVLVARPSIVGKSRPEVDRDFLAVLRQGSLLREPK